MGSLSLSLRSQGHAATIVWIGSLVASLGAVGLMVLTSDQAAPERLLLCVALLGTGAAGVGVAALVQRWAPRVALRGQLMIFGMTGLVLLIANVAVAAALMFLSSHDLSLLFVLCGYALATTIGPAQIMGRGLSRRIEQIEAAARRVAGGELAARVPVAGDDEVAALAREFNRMADALESSNARRDRIEQSRRDLFAAISHDLRTPLATIRVMVEAMSDGIVDDEATRQRYLHTASNEIQRLSGLIDDLFELTTIESGELHLRLETLRMEDVVAEAIDAFRPQVDRAGIHIAFEPSAETSTVYADPNRIGRVLYNLLQNAIRHTPHDGTIVLRTRTAGDAVEVIVADSGEGIASEDLPHVFERFYRGEKSRNRERGGSGLGLSIARGIVEAHGGAIRVESVAGQGTRFAFTVPVA